MYKTFFKRNLLIGIIFLGSISGLYYYTSHHAHAFIAVQEPSDGGNAGVFYTGSGTITLKVFAIVCDQESDLPDWNIFHSSYDPNTGAKNTGGLVINENTIATWLGGKPNCRYDDGWTFRYGKGESFPYGASSPTWSGWQNTGATSGGVTTAYIPATDSYMNDKWVQENNTPGTSDYVINEPRIYVSMLRGPGSTADSYVGPNYVPFATYNNPRPPESTPKVSTELRCYDNHAGYDNYEYVRAPIGGNTYSCVLFTAYLVPPAPATINVNTTCGTGSWVVNPGPKSGTPIQVSGDDWYSLSYTPAPGYFLAGINNSDNTNSATMWVPKGATRDFYVDCRPITTPQCSLLANGVKNLSISSGQSATLTWTSSNSTTVTGTNFNTGGALNNTSPGVSTGSLTTSQSYSITCTGSGGTVTDTATVTVGGVTPCQVGSFSANPPSTNSGGNTILSYASNGYCDSGTLNGGPWNNVSLSAVGYSASGNTSDTGPLSVDPTVFTYRVCKGTQCDSRSISVPVNNCQPAQTSNIGCPSGYTGTHTQTTTYSGASCTPSTTDNNQCTIASCTPSTSCASQGLTCGTVATGCPSPNNYETCGAPCQCTTAPSTAPTLSGSTSSQCGGKVQLNWTASSCATGYKIYRSGSYITTVTGTSYLDEGLEPNTGYGYKVRATNNYGESPDSNSIGPVTSGACTVADNYPVIDGSTNAQCGGNLDIWWTSVPGATGYNFYRSGTLILPNLPPTTTTYEERWLTPGTGFGYKVGAIVGGVEYQSAQIGRVTSRSCRITVNNNTTGSWTLSPGNLLGSGSSYKDISPASGGTTYTITPASVTGYNFPPTISNNITGSGSSVTLWPGSDATYTLNYTSAPASFDYSLAKSGDVTVTKGGTTQYGSNTISKTLISGSSQAVSLSVSGIPSGVSVNGISNQGCSPTCSSVITLAVSPTATAGTYPITVTGDVLSGKTLSYNLIVKDSPVLIVSCSAALSSNPSTATTTAKIGDSIIWTANASGGSGAFNSYSWSGSGLPGLGAKGPGANQYTITYSTIGQKFMRAQVVDSLGNSGICPDSQINIIFNPKIEEF